MNLQVSQRSYLRIDTKLPKIHKQYNNTTLDTQGMNFLNFYIQAAGLRKGKLGESKLPANVHYLYCTSLPQAETQYVNAVPPKHQQVKLLALEQLRSCMPEVAKIVT